MITHPAVAGELQKEDGAKTPHLFCQPTYFIPMHTVMTTFAFNYTPAWLTALCQHSGIFKLPEGYNILYSFFFLCRANCQDLSQILRPHSVIQAGSKCSCALVENLVRRGNSCDCDFPGYDSQFFPNNVNKTYIPHQFRESQHISFRFKKRLIS